MAERIPGGSFVDKAMSIVIPKVDAAMSTFGTQNSSGPASAANFVSCGGLCPQCGQFIPGGCTHQCPALSTIPSQPASVSEKSWSGSFILPDPTPQQILEEQRKTNQLIARLVAAVEKDGR